MGFIFELSVFRRPVWPLFDKSCLTYMLVVLLVFTTFSPTMASMGEKSTEMAVNSISSELNVDRHFTADHQDSKIISLLNHNLAVASGMNHATEMVMHMDLTQGEQCQTNCDCCPGLCSAYLPVALYSATFSRANIIVFAPAFKHKVSINTSLFRPPITH